MGGVAGEVADVLRVAGDVGQRGAARLVFAGREEGAEPIRVALARPVAAALAVSATVTMLLGVAPELVLRVAPLSALALG